MKTITSTLFLLFLQFGFAQIVTIPDANFKAKLLAHDPVIDTNSDGEIQVSEAEALDYALNVAEANISDLTGIEAFVNIKQLQCQTNNLTSVNLTTLTQLLGFTAWANHLESLDVSQNPALTSISVSDSNLTELDVSNNPNLENLQIGYNQIGELDLSNNPNLKHITSLGNPHVTLDFSQNPNLEFASLQGLPNLRMINFQNGNNAILDMYVHGNTFLECIQIDPEYVGSIPAEWDVQEGVTFSDNCILGLDESLLSEIEIYPNPVRNQFHIKHSERITSVEIYSLSGQKLIQQKGENTTEVNVSHLSKGTYIVRIQTQTGKVFTEKIIIK